ncbi:MAG TPA: hypothetical protein VFP03_06330 [Jiangellaceae bacterium]|nr:hypothetical protein [Jiangellaceae bacterium]
MKKSVLDAHRRGVVTVLQPHRQLADRIAWRGLRQPADHLLELARRDFARAAATVAVLRQSIGHGLHAALP